MTRGFINADEGTIDLNTLGEARALSKAPPPVGEAAKVWLPGESPWAECVAIHDDGSWEGRILNRLVAEMGQHEREDLAEHFWGSGAAALPSLHDFRQGQIVRFRLKTTDGCGFWMPAETMGGSA